MNPNHLASYQALQQAQKLRGTDPKAARAHAIQAAQLAPDLEEPWLMLAAVSSPRASVAYIQRALEINPQSERARKGMTWAVKRLREHQAAHPRKPAPVPVVSQTAPRAARPFVFYAILVAFAMCAVGLLAIWRVSPALAAIGNRVFAAAPVPSAEFTPEPNGGAAWAEVDLPKPTYTLSPTITQLPSQTPQPSQTPTLAPTDTEIPTLPPTQTLIPLESEATLEPIETTSAATPSPTSEQFAIVSTVEATATSEAALPPTAPPGVSHGGERWVEVNLTQQMLYAWEGDALVGSFIVSTGTWQYPTVTGTYRVWARFKYKDMSGPGYFLPDVPNTMFFYQGYAIHGTYWHNNFGTPMSHGCVNMTIPDSEWLFEWAPKDLMVNVHY